MVYRKHSNPASKRCRDLNQRCGILEDGQRRQSRDGKAAFVEIDPVVMDQTWRPEPGAAWMELERPDGLRLRIRSSGGAELLALAERFMGA